VESFFPFVVLQAIAFVFGIFDAFQGPRRALKGESGLTFAEFEWKAGDVSVVLEIE
jgi:hypothetical protein